MSKKLISKEDVQELKANPHIETASTRSVTFTPDFKKAVYDELLKGRKIKEIFEENGINTDALGECRLRGVVDKLYKLAERDEGFASLKKHRKARSPKEKEVSLEKQIRQLKAELAYTKQEVEFLKKTQKADMEARISWESKHRRK